MSLSLKNKSLSRVPKLKVIPENTEVEQGSMPRTQDSPSVPSPSPELPLQRARLEKRLSLAEIAHRLCLPEPTIKALEEERWDFFFQESSYVLGFIHSYGRVLGISGTEVAHRYKAFKAPTLPSDKESWLTDQPSGQQTASQSILWGSLCSSLFLIFLLTPYFCLHQQIDLTNASNQSSILLKKKRDYLPPRARASFVKKSSFSPSSAPSVSVKSFLDLLKERVS